MTRNRQPHHHSGPLSSTYSCFRPLPSDDNKTQHSSPPPPPPLAATANLTTSLYHTRIGMFAVTWSRNFLGRSLRIHLLHHHNHNNNNNKNNSNRRRQTHRSLSLPSSPCVTNSSSSSFHLTLKPYLFWNKQGSRKLLIPSIGNATVYWDLTRAKFGSGAPDPDSGFYIVIVLPGGEIALLLGDLDRRAQVRASQPRSKSSSSSSSSSKSSLPTPGAGQALVVRREHVQPGSRKLHRTRAQFGGKSREISIECDDDDRPDPSLVIRVDSTPAVQVNHLRWKFRGSERVEIDGHPLQISWDAHDWLFDAESSNQNSSSSKDGGGGGGFALFTFRFEKRAEECCFGGGEDDEEGVSTTTTSSWTEEELITGVENKEMGKRKRRSLAARKARSCSSSSLSSAASSSACGSVLEWESVEESELKGGPTAFSLVVYAWKS